MELPIEHFILAVHSLSSYLGMLLEDSLFPLCNVFDELCSNGSCKSEDYHPRRTRSHLVDTVCKDNESAEDIPMMKELRAFRRRSVERTKGNVNQVSDLRLL
ncbi:unnamed protein product [Rhizopus microsporus]|uniref:Uncharacterized protein n=1 Tax=Rhizopus microsporus TaxID=58291 RepID=A0A1X0SAQ5_RHIZD|nr:hypothetical protein BCV71DRAFT_288910 [Rhizopus microsporus]